MGYVIPDNTMMITVNFVKEMSDATICSHTILESYLVMIWHALAKFLEPECLGFDAAGADLDPHGLYLDSIKASIKHTANQGKEDVKEKERLLGVLPSTTTVTAYAI